MSEIAIVGSGGHAKVVVEALLLNTTEISKIIILDENPIADPYWRTVKFDLQLCASANLANCPSEFFHVAIGHNQTRENVAAKAGGNGALQRTVLHSRALVSVSSEIEAGTFVAAGSVVGPCAQLGMGCIVNHNAVVDHDCLVGSYCHIAPGAVLCGGVGIGDRVLVGAGSVVKPGVRIGNDCIVGAGAVVVRDIPDGTTFVGSPARKLDNI